MSSGIPLPIVDRAQKLLDEATPWPWEWEGNTDTKSRTAELVSVHNLRQFVFSPTVRGPGYPELMLRDADDRMVTAESLAINPYSYRGDFTEIDHPDARLIAAAPEIIQGLLNEVERLEDRMALVSKRLWELDEWVDKIDLSRQANKPELEQRLTKIRKALA